MLIISYLMSPWTPLVLDAVGWELEPGVSKALFAKVFVCHGHTTLAFPPGPAELVLSRVLRLFPREHSMPGGYEQCCIREHRPLLLPQ